MDAERKGAERSRRRACAYPSRSIVSPLGRSWGIIGLAGTVPIVRGALLQRVARLCQQQLQGNEPRQTHHADSGGPDVHQAQR